MLKEWRERRRLKKRPDVNDQIKYIQEEMRKYEPGTKEWAMLNTKLPEYYQRQNEAIDNSRRRGIKIGEVIGGLMISAAGVWVGVKTHDLYKDYLDKGFEFEKTGVFTSSTFRNLTSKIRIPFFK